MCIRDRFIAPSNIVRFQKCKLFWNQIVEVYTVGYTLEISNSLKVSLRINCFLSINGDKSKPWVSIILFYAADNGIRKKLAPSSKSRTITQPRAGPRIVRVNAGRID